MKTTLAAMFMLIASQTLAQSGGPKPLDDEFLDRLVGKWVVAGSTHDLSSPQTIEAEWVLNHQFVRIAEKTTENRPGWNIPYEAMLFVGYDRAQKRYVLHVLNVMGANEPSVTYGVRRGNEIQFEADAGQRKVGMRMIWRPESAKWRYMFGSQPAGGEWQTVTDLVLTRAK